MDVMRAIRLTARLATRAALGAAFTAAMLAAPGTARAGDDVPFDTKLIQGLLKGIGLQSGDEPQIDYQERSPLVIPQGGALPPPQTPGAAVANNPAWPKDADRARAKLEAERNRHRDTTAEMEHDSKQLRPDELTPGRSTARVYTRRPNAAPNASIGGDGTDRLNPSELGYQGGLFSKMFKKDDEESAARFTGEPPRVSLTDPPRGYQTPSPDQPYGLGREALKPKAEDYYTSHGEIKN